MDNTKGLIPPSFYLELKTKGRGTTMPKKSIFIHSSQLTDMSTNNLTIFEFEPQHININTLGFDMFREEHLLCDPQLCYKTVLRTFGISNDLLSLVIETSRDGKGIELNRSSGEWEPCPMVYKRE